MINLGEKVLNLHTMTLGPCCGVITMATMPVNRVIWGNLTYNRAIPETTYSEGPRSVGQIHFVKHRKW